MHQRHYCCSQLVFVRLIQFQRTVGPQLRVSKASEISSKNIIYIYIYGKKDACVVFAAFCSVFEMSHHSETLLTFSFVQSKGQGKQTVALRIHSRRFGVDDIRMYRQTSLLIAREIPVGGQKFLFFNNYSRGAFEFSPLWRTSQQLPVPLSLA